MSKIKVAGKKPTKRLRDKAAAIHVILEELYPTTPIPLDHSNPFTLLVAVLLSAQCTDERVNRMTPGLFALADAPEKMVQLSVEEIDKFVKPCGLSPTKARNIRRLSELLLEHHAGEVPNTFEALEALPGVGHKTASVVMSQAFGVPAFPVDTHIHRLAMRWGLSEGKNVVQVENDLKALFPEAAWNKIHLQIIFYGRQFCMARAHVKENCIVCTQFGVE